MAANFQQMGGVGGNNSMIMQPQNPQATPQQQLQQMLMSSIQTQTGPLSGWQVNITGQERLTHVWHLVTQLRLANNGQHDVQRICAMALHFEKATFDASPDKDTYTKTLNDKLSQLTAARSTQVQRAHLDAVAAQQAQAQAQAQMGMVGQQGMPGQMGRPGMNPQPQQAFQHLQHQMQASPVPGQQQHQPQSQQQQVPMGMINNGLPQNIAQPQQQFQMAMQQQQQQQQQQHHPQARQPQNMANRPQGSMALSAHDQNLVSQLTTSLMAAATDDEKHNIRMNLQSKMDQETLLRYQQQGLDPLILYYRNQAITRLRAQGMQANVKRPPPSVPMQQQRSANASMNGHAQQAQNLGTNQELNSFIGGVENLIGQQQQDGVLAQQQGQMVVPATMPPGTSTPQPMPAIPGQVPTPNGQRPVPNPVMSAQQRQQFLNAQQQQRMTQAAQSQAQIRANAQSKAQQQMALQGQPGGMGPMPPEQSPAMSTLNTPLRTPQQPAGSLDPSQINMANPAQFGAPIDPRFTAMAQQRVGQGANVNGGGLNTPTFPANMPQDQRQKIMEQVPKERLNEVLGRWQANYGGKPQMQNGMPVNMQAARLNQSGPFNQAGFANQLMANAQNGQRTPQAMMNGMNPQQQMLLQQQMSRMPQQQQAQAHAQAQLQIAQQAQRNMQPGVPANDPQHFLQIDNIAVPTNVLGNTSILRGVPENVKSWIQLKQWAAQNPASTAPNALDMLKTMQRQHYQTLLRARNNQMQQRQQQQQQQQQVGGPGMNQASNQPAVPRGMSAPVAPMMQGQFPNGAPMNIGNLGAIPQISQQDIARARAHNSGKFAGLTDEEIRTMIIKNTMNQRRQLLQQQQQGLMQMQIPQIPQMPQMTPQPSNQGVMQRPPGAQPAQAQQSQNQQQKQGARAQQKTQQPSKTVEPVQTAPASARGNKAARQANQNSSPPQPQRNLKRASSGDDVVEVPNPNLQQNARPMVQQPSAGQQKLPQQQMRPGLTPQQVQSLPPDQRKQYEAAAIRAQQAAQAVPRMQITPEDAKKCHAIFAEEHARRQELKPIQMTADERATVANKLGIMTPRLLKVKQIVARWFAITHDEERLRMFWRIHNKIAQQYQDENMQQFKEALSITKNEVEQAYQIANSMMADLAAKYPKFTKSAVPGGVANGARPAQNIQQTSPAQSIPLNAANLQQQQQAFIRETQKSHGRSGSRSTPAAPTSAHPPPFPEPSPLSPVPKYLAKPQLTQDNLRLPASKRPRHSATSTPQLGQLTPGSTASPHVGKTTSPPGRKAEARDQQKMEAQPLVLYCPEDDCDHHLVDGFEKKEELDKHIEEEHIKPQQNPVAFVLGELGSSLGLDPEGNLIKNQQNPSMPAPPLVAANGSQSNKANTSKVEGTPAPSGLTPMNGQPGGIGKTSPGASKLKIEQMASKPEGPKAAGTTEPTAVEDLWANVSVNPLDLLHSFKPLEPGAGAAGVFSDPNNYRIIMGEDTPESSKDGNSEPNSDISEGVDLNINLNWKFDDNWNPFGPKLILGEFLDTKLAESDLEPMVLGVEDLPFENSEIWDDFPNLSSNDAAAQFDLAGFGMIEEQVP